VKDDLFVVGICSAPRNT